MREKLITAVYGDIITVGNHTIPLRIDAFCQLVFAELPLERPGNDYASVNMKWPNFELCMTTGHLRQHITMSLRSTHATYQHQSVFAIATFPVE